LYVRHHFSIPLYSPFLPISKRLAASTLNTSGLIPLDITVALAGIAYLVKKNEAISKEWQYFPFPESDVVCFHFSRLHSLVS
jgi:hypothetical protein